MDRQVIEEAIKFNQEKKSHLPVYAVQQGCAQYGAI